MEELYLCADVGGTQIKTGLLTAAGELVGDITERTPRPICLAFPC